MKFIDTRTSICLTALAALSGADASHAGGPNAGPNLGAGLHHLADWNRDGAFADVMKQARSFGPADEPWTPGAVPTGGNGWPTGDGGVVLMTDIDGLSGYGGTYKISFYCATTPTINLPGGTPGYITNVNRNSGTGLVTADLVFPEDAHQMMLSFTNTAGGITGLKVMRPGYANETFTNEFLDHMERFSIIRFMDWTKTNNNSISQWADRPLPDTPSYAAHPGGVPWELCIELCNTLQRDAWINVPHTADDGYVWNLATLIRDTLDPSLRVYVEYSNEVWNFDFDQADWNRDQAVSEVNNNPYSDLAYDGATEELYWAARRIARRGKEISGLLRSVYGDQQFDQRVRPVLAAQVTWPEMWLLQGLNYIDTVHGPVDDSFAAAAGAPYFHLGSIDDDQNLTVDEVIDGLQSAVDSMCGSIAMERNAAFTTWHGLPLLAYEGGPDTFGPNNIESKRLASHDPRLTDICIEYMGYWYGWGFNDFVWYTAGAGSWETAYGTWTLTDSMSNQQTPKIIAIDTVLEAPQPPVTQGQFVPGAVDPRKHVFRSDNWEDDDYLLVSAGPGSSHDFLLRSDGWRHYTLQVQIGALQPGGEIEVLHNRESLGVQSVPSTGAWDSYYPTSPVLIGLNDGMNVLRLRQLTGVNHAIGSIDFRLAGDLDQDDVIDVNDLVTLLANWGSCWECPGDIDRSGVVDVSDLLFLLNNWGADPQANEIECPEVVDGGGGNSGGGIGDHGT